MNEAFEKLEREKQDRIIDAALDEFAEHGLTKASTNRIVKAAGIGKGMLFYYFRNKLELYSFLLDYAIACLQEHFAQAEWITDVDIIERYRKLNEIKMANYFKNRKVYDFITRVYLDKTNAELSEDVRMQLAFIEKKREDVLSGVFSSADTSLFRNDILPENILKYIKWSMDGFTQDIINRVKDVRMSSMDYAPYLEEYETYLSDLKKLFYK